MNKKLNKEILDRTTDDSITKADEMRVRPATPSTLLAVASCLSEAVWFKFSTDVY